MLVKKFKLLIKKNYNSMVEIYAYIICLRKYHYQ